MSGISTLCVLALVGAFDSGNDRSHQTAIAKGVAYLRAHAENEHDVGKTALALLALVKAGALADDAAVKKMTARLAANISSEGYRSAHADGVENYEAPLTLMALAALDRKKFLGEIEFIAKFIALRQQPNGAWNYADQRDDGDTSMTQYALLGLREASDAGVEIPNKVWDLALHWCCTHQGLDGGFAYHPVNRDGTRRVRQPESNHTMTVAGAACMYICQAKLNLKRRTARPVAANELLIPVEPGGDAVHRVKSDSAVVEKGLDDAARWIANHAIVAKPTAHNNLAAQYYYLYGFERYAAFAKLTKIGDLADWYKAGGDFLAANQKSNGSWDDGFFGPIVNTSFALLFLRKTTRAMDGPGIAIRFGSGTMSAGRGLPTQLDLIAGLSSRKKLRYLIELANPIDDILRMFENPEEFDFDDATANSIAATFERISSDELVKMIGSDMRKMRRAALSDKPQVRRVGVAALSRTKDYRAVPILIAALSDSDAETYRAARDGLRFISRKLDDLGLPESNPSPEQIKQGTARWTEWFNGLKIRVDADQQFDDPKR